MVSDMSAHMHWLGIPEKEGKSFASPTRAVHYCRKYPLRALFVRCEDEKSDADAD